jgi:hypothetical protein
LTASVEDIERAVVTLAEVWRGKGAKQIALPNLVGVGSGRCGTSHVYGLLRPQDDVYVTPVKEANYFGVASRQGMTLAEYRTFFAGRRDERWISEITPVYLHAPGGLEEMREALGPIRLIVTLRNPLTRTVSHFKFHRGYHGYDDLGAYLDAGVAEIARGPAKTWAAASQGVRMSLYADRLAAAIELFGRENLLVLIYEDLVEDPAIWTRQLSDFLSIPIDGSLVAAVFRNPSKRESVELPDTPAAGRMRELFAEDAAKLEPMIGAEVLKRWADESRQAAAA